MTIIFRFTKYIKTAFFFEINPEAVALLKNAQHKFYFSTLFPESHILTFTACIFNSRRVLGISVLFGADDEPLDNRF